MDSRGTWWLSGAGISLIFALASCSDSGTSGGNTAIAGTGFGTGGLPGASATGAVGTAGQIGAGTAGTAAPLAGRPGTGTAGIAAPTGGRPAAAGTGSSVPPAGTGSAGMMASAGTSAVAGMAAPAGSGAAGGGDGMLPAAGSGTPPPASGGCTPPPPGGSELMKGPFQTMVVSNTGPSGQYTMFRPTMLGMNGFKHPPVSWGNGVTTTPDLYTAWLSRTASHGFVVIASNSSSITAEQVRQGLEWLIMQNASGDFAGKLAVDCAATIGYSMGGGAAVGAGSHPAVKAVVSVHGLPGASGSVSGPLLLTTSDDDGFVTREGFAQPGYDASSKQPTILATYITGNAASFNGHLTPLGDGKQDSDPTIAWLRYWLYGDQGQKNWFFGPDCKLCVKPWGMIQRKNYMWE